MPKKNPKFEFQYSIDDKIDAMYNYQDEHLDAFICFLFDELLIQIQKFPFDRLISELSTGTQKKYEELKANGLLWLYTADRNLIDRNTIYTFRFGSIINPELYKSFVSKYHHKFQIISYKRHRVNGWYKYVGKNVLKSIDHYVNSKMVTENNHETRLYINQSEERLDIEIRFPEIHKRITICFERGSPSRW